MDKTPKTTKKSENQGMCGWFYQLRELRGDFMEGVLAFGVFKSRICDCHLRVSMVSDLKEGFKWFFGKWEKRYKSLSRV